jgi:hypothetical protein
MMARVLSGSLKNQISTCNVECGVVVYVLVITLYTTPFWTDAQKQSLYNFITLYCLSCGIHTRLGRVDNPLSGKLKFTYHLKTTPLI